MDEIADDEILLRHIPGGTLWQAPGPRITSANFRLRHDQNETGISVTRAKITTPQRLLEMVGASLEQGSRVGFVRAGDARQLGLCVVPRPVGHDAGHAEIQSGQARLDDQACRKKLAMLFHFLPDQP